ncbi:lysine-rich arabinogalactan protein 19-like [Iris pallida]|uniref:Lysine-rich arabinogalactan protein 19-like n=1 Tax=Iris pallida TaxID=29817 RepID=A0AAX6GHQ7_IRIPA|nr:lysine-rich arabinogalactan protein 19-like [Iris pallida]KAJ6835915.1 lysine-rich arabinogalactan protein 19-like [Iris pallida]
MRGSSGRESHGERKKEGRVARSICLRCTRSWFAERCSTSRSGDARGRRRWLAPVPSKRVRQRHVGSGRARRIQARAPDMARADGRVRHPWPRTKAKVRQWNGTGRQGFHRRPSARWLMERWICVRVAQIEGHARIWPATTGGEWWLCCFLLVCG